MLFLDSAKRRSKTHWFFLGAALSACAGPGPKQAEAVNPSPTLVILYVSDLHSHIRPDEKGRGGYARLKAWIDAERQQAGPQTDVLVLGGGDLIGKGGIPCLKTEDRACAPLLGDLGFDFAVPGNHELYRALPDLKNLLSATRTKWISSNVSAKVGSSVALPWSEGLQVYQGPKSGIELSLVGWTFDPAFGGDPRARAGYRVRRTPGPEDWKRWGALASQRPLLFLTHQEIGEDRKFLARACELLPKNGVLALLKANDHVERRAETQHCAPLLEPGPFGRYGLRVTVQRRGAGSVVSHHEFVAMEESRGEGDPGLKARIDELYRQQGSEADEVVATLSRPRSKEEVAQWLADAYRASTRADVAVTNLGLVKASLPQGQVSREKMLTTLPYSNPILGLDWSLRDLQRSLCRAAARTWNSDMDFGSELYLSGARIENVGRPDCRVVLQTQKALPKVAVDSYVAKRSLRWLGEDVSQRTFHYGLDTRQVIFLQLRKSAGKF